MSDGFCWSEVARLARSGTSYGAAQGTIFSENPKLAMWVAISLPI